MQLYYGAFTFEMTPGLKEYRHPKLTDLFAILTFLGSLGYLGGVGIHMFLN